MNTLHIAPRGDLLRHDCGTDEPDCICGPRCELVPGDGDGWMVIHNSLDGREVPA